MRGNHKLTVVRNTCKGYNVSQLLYLYHTNIMEDDALVEGERIIYDYVDKAGLDIYKSYKFEVHSVTDDNQGGIVMNWDED